MRVRFSPWAPTQKQKNLSPNGGEELVLFQEGSPESDAVVRFIALQFKLVVLDLEEESLRIGAEERIGPFNDALPQMVILAAIEINKMLKAKRALRIINESETQRIST